VIESAHWTIALAVAVLIGVAGTLYFRLVVMRRDETAAGLSALAAMSWREFIHLVLDALARRGYARVHNRETPSGDNDYTLERDGKHWLLSCKHGSAFVLGGAHVVELANDIRLANAAGGILASQGRIAAEARPAAALQRIELLDGPTLWPELRDLIDPAQRAEILAGASRKARQRTLLSWLLALLAGVATFLALPGSDDAAARAAAAVVAAPAGPALPQADAAIANEPIAAPAPDDAAGLEQQRHDVAEAVSTLPMVDRAVWSTQSTLQVYLLDTSTDAMPQICPLVVRYDALAPSRIQLTPPAGSDAPTRFRQCRSY
jgi:restriction system protein